MGGPCGLTRCIDLDSHDTIQRRAKHHFARHRRLPARHGHLLTGQRHQKRKDDRKGRAEMLHGGWLA